MDKKVVTLLMKGERGGVFLRVKKEKNGVKHGEISKLPKWLDKEEVFDLVEKLDPGVYKLKISLFKKRYTVTPLKNDA